jgi:hypothetical protein
MAARPALADEFDTVALGDPLYDHLTTVRQAGWLGESEKTAAAPRQALTRYEIALEAARAIFTLNARYHSDDFAVNSSSRRAVRAVRELTQAMRPELKTLNIDTAAVLMLCEQLSNPQLSHESAAPPRSTPVRAASAEPAGVAPGAMEAGFHLSSSAWGTKEGRLELPVAQRVRLYSVISTLARDAQDPFADDSIFGPRHTSKTLNFDTVTGITATGAAVDVKPWLRWSAGSEHHAQRTVDWRSSFLLNDAARLNTTDAYEHVTGVDIKTPFSGIVLHGNYAYIHTDDKLAARRFEAAIGYSGWQNRLALTANLSRLVPEDSVPFSALTSTTAGNLNIAVDVTNRISLNLLYQQLFGSQNQFGADRAVAGGLSIKF